jgi:hypothetical protein|tara:strand:+ start:1596 stop:1850 length:255 start_codon:yes stop_codon:yes gene_type:complete
MDVNLEAEFKQLLNCDNKDIANLGERAKEIKAMYENKEISNAEFKELVNDLKLSEHIADAADDMAVKSASVKVLDILSKMASAI